MRRGRLRAIGAILVAFATGVAGASIFRPPVGGGIPPGGQTANVWVQIGGGACTRSSSLRTLANSTTSPDSICGTWDAANDTANGGDVVLIKAGSYGDQLMTGSNARGSQDLMAVATGETVTVGTFSNCSRGSGGSAFPSNCASQYSLTGPLTSNSPQGFDGIPANITLDNLDLNFLFQNACISCGTSPNLNFVQPFHACPTSGNFTVKNSKIHNAVNVNAMVYLDGTCGINSWTFDNNDFYNSYDTTGGAVHTECIYAWGVANVTFTRNQWWSCSTEDIFLTGTATATNWNVENNVFEHPLGPNSAALAFRQFNEPSPNPDNFTLRNNTFGREAGVQWNVTDNPVTVGGFFIYGNVASDQVFPCSGTNITVDYNATPSSCGAHSTIVPIATLKSTTTFTNPKNWGTSDGGGCNASTNPATGCLDSTSGDYSLATGSPIQDVCQPTAFPTDPHGFPATDILGLARPVNSAADCGAYESPITTATANVWLQVGGGSCTRVTPAVTFSNALVGGDHICGTPVSGWTAASSGDVIRARDGTYSGNSIFTGNKTSETCIIGETQAGTVISASDHQTAAFLCLQNLTVNNGTTNFPFFVDAADIHWNNVVYTGTMPSIEVNGARFTWIGGSLGDAGTTPGLRCIPTGNGYEPFAINGSNTTVKRITIYPQGGGNAPCDGGSDGFHEEDVRINGGANNTLIDGVTFPNGDSVNRNAGSGKIFWGNGGTSTGTIIRNTVFGGASSPNTATQSCTPSCSCPSTTFAYNTFIDDARADACTGTSIQNYGPGSAASLQVTALGRLLAGSPAIDAGPSGCAVDTGGFDVDGDVRPFGAACDQGADEFTG